VKKRELVKLTVGIGAMFRKCVRGGECACELE